MFVGFNWLWEAHSDEHADGALTQRSALARLMLPSEERSHPWAKNPPWFPGVLTGPDVDLRLSTLWEKPLLRHWDCYSGSQPDSVTRHMIARDPALRLDTFEIRKETLQNHIDPTSMKATPYISFLTDPKKLEIEIQRKQDNGKTQRVTLVDPQARLRLRLPILRFADEFKHYKLYNPSRSDVSTSHWICLWEVTPAEVVWTWEWDDLKGNPQWYQEIVLPVLRRFQATGLRPDETH
jgi:hypothetical protein